MEKHLVLSCSIWKAVKKDDESNVQGGTGMRERDMIPCRSKCHVDASWGHRISKTVCSMSVCVRQKQTGGGRKREKERVMDCWDQT